MKSISIATLITCHNRREKTVACLQSLFDQELKESWQLVVYVVDAGSTDGTVEAIRRRFPQVRLLCCDDSLYWCGGMHYAWDTAAKSKDYDYYLWLNDDVRLYKDVIKTMLDSIEDVRVIGGEGVIVGSVCDSVTGNISYGGEVNGKKIIPNGRLQKCGFFNGNVVLVPIRIFECVGNFDPIFTHWFGDTDYGLRVKNAGYSCWVAGHYVGTCRSNPKGSEWANPNLTLRERYEIFNSRKGLPLKEWVLYSKRRFGIKWPVTVIKIYLRLLFPRLWMYAKKHL